MYLLLGNKQGTVEFAHAWTCGCFVNRRMLGNKIDFPQLKIDMSFFRENCHAG